MNQAVEILSMPMSRIKAIKKAIAVLCRAGISREDAIVIVLEHQRAPYDAPYAVATSKR
jgi:hypothetical protein